MRAIIIVENGFQDEEFVYPYYRMLEAGWLVDVASPDGQERRGKYGVPARSSMAISKAIAADFEVLVIPGGFESPDRLRMREDVQALVRWAERDKKVIGAICHGPWVLVSAGICKGTTMTSYPSIEPDLVNAGANYVNTPVAVDRLRRVVTAQHYRDNANFMSALISEAARFEWGPELCGAAAR